MINSKRLEIAFLLCYCFVMKIDLILDEVKLNTSYVDSSTYKTYTTNFFSYTNARHRIQYLYDENDNVHFVKLYEIIDRKVDPETNDCFIRAEFEFEDHEDMDFLLHKPLYFKEQEWFHDLTHEEIIQLDCIFEQYEAVLGPLIERQNITICMDGTVQIDDKTYYLSKSRIYNFFDEIRINIGSEKTYKPFLCGGCSS